MSDSYIGNTQLAVLIAFYKKHKYTNSQILTTLTREGINTKSGEQWQLRNLISFITRNVDPYLKELGEAKTLQEELGALTKETEANSTKIINKLMEGNNCE